MKLVVVSHKVCWPSPDATSGFSTDGGFPFQMQYLSEIFTGTTLVVPCEPESKTSGVTPLSGNNITVVPLSVPSGRGMRRKLSFFWWLFENGRLIWRSVKNADAVHAPIPGDVGTIGLLFALILRKRLFVRHCGNWLKPRTVAERCWKFGMEMLAGKRNAMLATGGGSTSPSDRNPNIEWIYSTSLTEAQVSSVRERITDFEKPRIVVACRQEKLKGTDIVIRALPQILDVLPDAELIVAGDGSYLDQLKSIAKDFGVLESVTFCGKLSQKEVVDLLRSSDMFCFPTSASEGFPKVVIEALAAGLPVVSTRVSVIPHLLASGGGVLLESRDPKELADAVIGILLDREKYAVMSRYAKETARDFTLENWRDRIETFLQRSWGDEHALREIGNKGLVRPL